MQKLQGRSWRILCIVLVILLLGTNLLGCNNTPTNNDGGENTAQNGKVINNGEPVTIIVNLGEYAPTDNEIATENAPNVFNSTRELIEKFEAMYPNVTVKLDTSAPSAAGDYVAGISQWMLPRLAAGTQMDIATNLSGAALFGDNDWFMDLSEVLEESNDYIAEGEKGHDKWIEQWPSYLFDSTSIVNTKGQIVAIPYTLDCGAPTAYYYNKSIFAELNLEIPKTWEQLMTACETIRKAGYIAFAPYGINTNIDLQNWDTQFSLGPIYGQYKLSEFDYNGDGRQDQMERVRAVKEGIYNPLTNDYAMDIWKQIKRKYNVETSPILEDGWETTDYSEMWEQGKVAMWEDKMSALPTMISNTNLSFEFGMFPPPVISNDTYDYLPEAVHTESGPRQPGVQSCWVFLKKSMEEKPAGVKEACIEFVKFMTTSENLSAVVTEKRGAVLGSTYACKIPSELGEWMKQSFPVYPSTTGWLTANTADYRQQGNKLLEQWIYGDISDQEFAKKLNEYSQADADKIIANQGIDTSDWTIKE